MSQELRQSELARDLRRGLQDDPQTSPRSGQTVTLRLPKKTLTPGSLQASKKARKRQSEKYAD
jgi:hypothetical protein